MDLRYPLEVPELVLRAKRLATELGFDLLFFDGGGRESLLPGNWNLFAGLVKVGGIMILDDLTPEEQWPNAWRGLPDQKRDLAFVSGVFTSTELPTSPNTSLLLMVRNDRSVGD